MANMSNCRFQNIYLDFSDCISALQEMTENQDTNEREIYCNLSDQEKLALKNLLESCDEFKELAEELLENNNDA